MSQQGLRQASVRAATGRALDYNGDWHALFDLQSIPAGDFNGRMLAWINQQLVAGYANVNDAMAAFAAARGAATFSSLGSFSILGPELSVPFVVGGTGFTVVNADGTHIVTFGAGTCRYQSDTITPVLSVMRNGILTAGRTYRVSVGCSVYVSGAVKSDAFTGGPVIASALGTVTSDVVASNTHFSFTRNSANVDLTLSGISIREVLS